MNRGSSSTCVVAGRVHSGPHVDKPCRIPPCFQLGHVPGRDPLGPLLHLDGGGGWGCHGRPFIQCARAHRPTGPPGRRRRFPRWAGTAIALLYTSWVLVPDRRRRGGGSDPAEVRHVRDLRFVYAAARRPAPRSCGVLVVRGDRSCPRGVYPRSAPVHQNPPLAAGGRSYGSSSVQGLPRSAETPATSHQGGEEAGLGRVSGQPRLRSLVAPLQDSIEQTPPMGTSRNREHGPSVPRGGRQYCVPGSGKRGRWQVCR